MRKSGRFVLSTGDEAHGELALGGGATSLDYEHKQDEDGLEHGEGWGSGSYIRLADKDRRSVWAQVRNHSGGHSRDRCLPLLFSEQQGPAHGLAADSAFTRRAAIGS